MTDDHKHDAEDKLHKTLKETFPASDPSSGNVIDRAPNRPLDRKPAEIDERTVDRLSRELDEKQKTER